MPRRESSTGKAATNLPVLVDLRLLKALDHVLRQHILLAAVQGEISPIGLSKALGEGLSHISYHIRVLRDDCDGMIEETRTEQRRGAVEHFYRASTRTLLPAKAWRGVRGGLRAVIGAGQASDLFNDLAEALEAGKLQGPHDHITRAPLVLDAQGLRNVKAIAERATGEVENEQQAAAGRMAKTNGDGGGATGYTFALLAFEAAWEPADPNGRLARAKGSAMKSVNGASGADHNGGGGRTAKPRVKGAGRQRP
jgi:hypothetical protein